MCIFAFSTTVCLASIIASVYGSIFERFHSAHLKMFRMQGIHVVGKHWKIFSAKKMNILASIVRKKCTNSSPSPFCGYFKKPPFSPLCKGGENSRLKSRDRSEAGGGNKRAPPNHPFSPKKPLLFPAKSFLHGKVYFFVYGERQKTSYNSPFLPISHCSSYSH